jgi:hypothetical protein
LGLLDETGSSVIEHIVENEDEGPTKEMAPLWLVSSSSAIWHHECQFWKENSFIDCCPYLIILEG